MSSRLLAGALAIAYLLAATPWAWASVRVARAVGHAGHFPADFPCAQHHCGCRSAADCRRHCCCLMRRIGSAPQRLCPLEATQQHRRTVSYLAAKQCFGHGPTSPSLGISPLDPHLPQLLWARVPTPAFERGQPLHARQARSAFVRQIDRVPIS